MKNLLVVLSLLVSGALFTGCLNSVPAGNVGVKVYLLGGDKGVDNQVLPVGRYWIGMNEELYLFPTFQQTVIWTKSVHEGRTQDESLTFQTKEGMEVNVDLNLSYSLDPAKIAVLFQTYRKGTEEISDVILRNAVRDALVKYGSNYSVEETYSNKKQELLDKVRADVGEKFLATGIRIETIGVIGAARLPPAVTNALNSKIEATQKAQQSENELRKAEAEAKIAIANANGEAQSRIINARAEAQSNQIISQSLTANLVKYEEIKRWNGSYAKTVLGSGASVLVTPEN